MSGLIAPLPCPACEGTGATYAKVPFLAGVCRDCAGEGTRPCANCPTEVAVLEIEGDAACLVCSEELLTRVGSSGGCTTTWADALDMLPELEAVRAALGAT